MICLIFIELIKALKTIVVSIHENTNKGSIIRIQKRYSVFVKIIYSQITSST